LHLVGYIKYTSSNARFHESNEQYLFENHTEDVNTLHKKPRFFNVQLLGTYTVELSY